MTREEVKDLLFRFVKRGMTMKNISFEMAIDEIYDEIESRTCENCKYYEERIQGMGECNNIIYEGFSVGLVYDYDNMFLPKDFGCNKWESK